jgi:hypothetical protein
MSIVHTVAGDHPCQVSWHAEGRRLTALCRRRSRDRGDKPGLAGIAGATRRSKLLRQRRAGRQKRDVREAVAGGSDE